MSCGHRMSWAGWNAGLFQTWVGHARKGCLGWCSDSGKTLEGPILRQILPEGHVGGTSLCPPQLLEPQGILRMVGQELTAVWCSCISRLGLGVDQMHAVNINVTLCMPTPWWGLATAEFCILIRQFRIKIIEIVKKKKDPKILSLLVTCFLLGFSQMCLQLWASLAVSCGQTNSES